jgi:hypothetical protein
MIFAQQGRSHQKKTISASHAVQNARFVLDLITPWIVLHAIQVTSDLIMVAGKNALMDIGEIDKTTSANVCESLSLIYSMQRSLHQV